MLVVVVMLVGEVLLLLLPPFPLLLKPLLPGPGAVAFASPSSSTLHAVVVLEGDEGVDLLLLLDKGRNLVVDVAAPATDDAEAVAGGVPGRPAEDAAA